MATQTNDITAIRGYAGSHAAEIITSVVNGLDIANDVTVIRNLKAPRNLTKYKGNKGFRPNNTSIEEPKGKAGSFSTRKITPKVGMKIFHVIPEELRETFLSEQLSPNAKEYPAGFAQYFWLEQNQVLQSEINDNCYDSVDSEDINAFDPARAYAVGEYALFQDDFYECIAVTTAGQSPATHSAKWMEMNNAAVTKGFGTIIGEEYATLPAQNKVATGVITDLNAYDKFRSFYTSMPIEYRKLGGFFYVSYDLYDAYMTNVQEKFKVGTSFVDAEKSEANGGYIYGSGRKWQIKPCTWMGASKRIIATQKANLVMGTDLTSDFNSLGKVVETLHGYKGIMKLILSFQIVDLECLFVNDQA